MVSRSFCGFSSLFFALSYCSRSVFATDRSYVRGMDVGRALKECYRCPRSYKEVNPCEGGDQGYYEHCNPNMYIQCGVNAACFDRDCAPGTMWDQHQRTCVHEKLPGQLGSCGECEDNPCTEENLSDGMFYHKHCNKNKKYLQCGIGIGICYEMDCAPGTVWRQNKQTCVARKK